MNDHALMIDHHRPGLADPAARTAAPAGLATPGADRRRPGRNIEVHPSLLTLLRHPDAAAPALWLPPDDALPASPIDHLLARTRDDGRTQLAAAKGFAFGLLLAVPLWTGLAAGAHWVLGG